MTFKSGKSATATVAGNELPIVGWDVNPTADIARFRNSKTSGATLKEATFKDCTGSFDLDFDFDANPYAAPLNLTPGTVISTVKCYLDGTSGKYWSFTSVVVSSTPQSVNVEGKIVTRINWEADGAWTPPA